MKRKLKVPKERNPYVAHLATKRSGAHGKTRKAERRASKMALRQENGPRPTIGQLEQTFNLSP